MQQGRPAEIFAVSDDLTNIVHTNLSIPWARNTSPNPSDLSLTNNRDPIQQK